LNALEDKLRGGSELLIVSRDRELLGSVERLLAGSSWRRFVLRQADDITTALDTAARRPVRAVLLDMELANAAWMQTLLRLKQALPNIPVVALGDPADVDTGVLALRSGAQDVVSRTGLSELVLERTIRFATERQRREQCLREYIRDLNVTQGQLHALLQTAADGHIVVDDEGTILYANPAAETLFGRDESDLRGGSFGFPVIGQDFEVIEIFCRGRGLVTAEMRVARTQWDGDPAHVISLRDVSARHVPPPPVQGTDLAVSRDARRGAERAAAGSTQP
jgi:PAS domain-containing protein